MGTIGRVLAEGRCEMGVDRGEVLHRGDQFWVQVSAMSGAEGLAGSWGNPAGVHGGVVVRLRGRRDRGEGRG